MMAVKRDPLLVIDIGGTTVKYGVWQAEQLTDKGKFMTPATWPELLAALTQLKVRQTSAITGVAISLPGSVDPVAGKISGTSAVSYLNNFPIKAVLTRALGVPVSIQNDANCAALAELWQGNAEGLDSAVFMIIGTGIGGAVVMNGQLMTGPQQFSGEFGYMVMNEQGATLSEIGSPVKMAARFTRLKCLATPVSAQTVFRAAQAGDPVAQTCVTEMTHWLSCGAFNLSVGLNPQRVLIGGGISARPGFVADLQDQVQQLMVAHHAPLTVDLRPCHFLNDANLIGAAAQFYTEHPANAALSANGNG